MNERNLAMNKLAAFYAISAKTMVDIARELRMSVASISNYVHKRHAPGSGFVSAIFDYVDAHCPRQRNISEVL